MRKIVPNQVALVLKTLRGHINGPGQWLALKYEPRVLPEVIPFLNPIDSICEEPPPRIMWSAHYIILAMFIAILIAATIAKVDVVVVGGGSLTTESPPIVLQPIDRGIIRELKVAPGDPVHRGQVLAVLDPTFARADLAAVGDEVKSLTAQINRLQAEYDDKPLELGKDPSVEEKLQYSLYLKRQDLHKSRLRVFDEDVERLNATLRTTEDDRASLATQLGYAKELENMRGALLQSQNGSKLSYLDAETLRVRTARDYQDSVDRLVELQHALQSKLAERQSFLDEWRHQILENLLTARSEVDKQKQTLSKVSLLNDLVVVTAPEDGVVLDVAKRSVGSVMREAEPLVTIVPSNTRLVADIVINSSDVGHIQPGDEVVVKVDAFPYQLHGLMRGRLLYVSEDSSLIADAGGQGLQESAHGGGAVHRARVELIDTALEHMPKGAHLIPGMTVSAEIRVASRRVISFFIYPITRGLGESLREP